MRRVPATITTQSFSFALISILIASLLNQWLLHIAFSNYTLATFYYHY